MRRAAPLRAALLLLALPLTLPAAAGDVAVTGSATLTASADTLSGELALTLQGVETVHAPRLAAIGRDAHAVLREVERWQPGEMLRVPLRLARAHARPGHYHLLVEATFQDRAGAPLSVYLQFRYVFQRAGGQPTGPALAIAGDRLEWGEPGPGVTGLELTLTSGPFWQLVAPVGPGAESFLLEQTADGAPLANFAYPQLAALEWLGPDGYHYSRVIPWTIRTDGAGQWIRAARPGLLDTLKTPAVILLAAGILLLLPAAALAARHERAGRRDAALSLFGASFVVALTLWLASFTHPELWFSTSWPTGGDLASHVLYAERFREWLFDGRITGWMPEVFAGFPAFRYYFPLPFALAALLSLLVPLQVALKIVSMLPALLVPPAVYWMGGCLRWPAAARAFAALFSIGFLVHDGSSIWGGNLLAQLSGEFSYSWGMLLTLLFWGSLARALRAGGRAWIAPAVLEALVGLSHGYSLLIAGFSALLLPLFCDDRRRALLVVLKIHLAAFLLLGFWLLPLLENLPHTIPNDTPVGTLDFGSVVPGSMLPLLLALPLLVMALIRQRDGAGELRFMVLTALLAAVAFAGASAVALADVRFFPYVQLTAAIALGAGMGVSATHWGPRIAAASFAAAALALTAFWLKPLEQVEEWSRWNLSGYEAKAQWPHYRALADHLRGGLSEPRVIFEHHPDNNDVGSTRALEALPLFGSRPVLEGLYMESALSGPFIYQLQAEISEHPSGPLSRFPPVKGIAGDVADRLRDFYVDTVVARSEETVRMLDGHSGFTRETVIGPFTVFRLKQSAPLIEAVTAIGSEPATDGWLAASFRDYLLPGPRPVRKVFGLAPLPDRAVAAAPAEVELVSFDREHIRFRTAQPGVPHLVRMTWHPGWRSLGGEPIYPAEPAFMVLVPASAEVELVFGPTPAQRIGVWLTLAGVLLLFANPLRIGALVMDGARRDWLVAGAVLFLLGAVAFVFHPNRSYMSGHESLREQEWRAAATAFDAALARRSVPAQRAEALFWAARSHEWAGAANDAVARYRALIEDHPESSWAPESLYRLAGIYAAQGNAAEASRVSGLLLSRFPGSRWAGERRRSRLQGSIADSAP